MNFRIIYHLIQTDWHKLKWPLVGLWCIIAITALRWLTHPPASFEFPYWTTTSGILSRGTIHDGSPPAFALIGSLLALGLAAELGLQARGRALVSPVRSRERTVAQFTAILLFLVAPQALCVGLNLIRQGMPMEVVVRATLGYGITVLMVLGVAALFSAWCASWWHLLAGITSVAAGHAIYSMMPGATPLPPLALFYSHLWAAIVDGRTLGALGLAAVLLGFVRVFHSGRLSASLQVVAAVVIFMGSLAVTVVPASWKKTKTVAPPEIPLDKDPGMIRPVIRPESVWMQSTSDQFLGSMGGVFNQRFQQINHIAGSAVAGIIDTVGTPAGQFVVWKATSTGRLVRSGRTVATRVQEDPADSRNSIHSGSGYPMSDVEAGDLAAMVGALPNNTPPVPDPRWHQMPQEEPRTYLGCFSPLEPVTSWDEGSLTLEIPITGTVYRYERVIDVPLADQPSRIQVGDAIYQIRRRPSGEDYATCAELTLIRPALGFAGKADSPDSADLPWRWFLHVPGQNTTLPVEVLGSQGGPVLAGAAWQRQIYGQEWLSIHSRPLKRKLPTPNLTSDMIATLQRLNNMFAAADARLVMLKPVVVTRLPAVTLTVAVQQSRHSQRDSDYALNFADGMNDWIFLRDHLPNRPDPRTCTKSEFGRWLRVAAGDKAPAFALTGYAKRFTGVLARVPGQGAHTAIELETPASARAEVLDRLADTDSSAAWIALVTRRGWADEGAAAIRWCYLHRPDGNYNLDDVLRLEDPATYPKLIATLLRHPNLDLYEKIRLLPGIDSVLDRAIDTALARADFAQVLAAADDSNRRPCPFAPYLVAAARGNAKALDAMIAIQNEINRKRGKPFEPSDRILEGLLAANDKWKKNLKTMSAMDLRFDPLTRRWQPLTPP